MTKLNDRKMVMYKSWKMLFFETKKVSRRLKASSWKFETLMSVYFCQRFTAHSFVNSFFLKASLWKIFSLITRIYVQNRYFFKINFL